MPQSKVQNPRPNQDLSGYVPYSGATGNVDLGAHNYLGTDVNITGDIYLDDSKKFYLGDGNDASIYYDGTDLIINPREVGSGDVIITDGGSETNIEINNTAGDGDPQLRFALTGTTKYSIGIDDSDGDILKIHSDSGVSTSDHLFEFDRDNATVGTKRAQFIYKDRGSFNAGDTTPSVKDYNRFRFPDEGRGYGVTTFDEGTEGQIIYLNFQRVTIIVTDQSNGGNNIYLSGGNNFTSTRYSTLTLIKTDGDWLEIGRSQY